MLDIASARPSVIVETIFMSSSLLWDRGTSLLARLTTLPPHVAQDFHHFALGYGGAALNRALTDSPKAEAGFPLLPAAALR